MVEPTPPPARGFMADLLREESRLPERLFRVVRFDASVYAELEADRQALAPAFTVVLATALAVGLGQPSLPGIFLGVAGAITIWATSTALVWAIGTLVSDAAADYGPLLRCTGFAFAWNALAIGASLPLVGGLIEWVSPLLWAAALVLATRQVFQLQTVPAVAVVAVALGAPLLVLLIAA
jgi:hypothetical protein